MPFAKADDGVKLHYEESGRGDPLVFVHEFAGDCRSWEPQLRYFSRRYRCIAFNARGYPPSDVPDDPSLYSQARARDDIKAVLDHLGLAAAHIVGLSMGGFATLHFGLEYAAMARSLVVAGCGYGAEPARREQFQAETEATAGSIEAEGMEAFAERYGSGPARLQFMNKDPRGWRELVAMLGGHSAMGSALTMRGVQGRRPSLWDLEDAMAAMTVPTLIVTGDEDEPCLAPAILMKRAIPSSGLVMVPKTGHTINLEEPDAFNRALGDFLTLVEAGRWDLRDPGTVTESILGDR
jgi:pimeloyl-ACP methyl ester carboxylesterase